MTSEEFTSNHCSTAEGTEVGVCSSEYVGVPHSMSQIDGGWDELLYDDHKSNGVSVTLPNTSLNVLVDGNFSEYEKFLRKTGDKKFRRHEMIMAQFEDTIDNGQLDEFYEKVEDEEKSRCGSGISMDTDISEFIKLFESGKVYNHTT